MVTVILTKHKRTNLFDEQYQSVLRQTLKPTEILVCDNTIQNTGVWGRFSLSLMAKNEYICVIDDDTIPGNQWLENCYDNFQLREGLYGTCGYVFNSNTHYKDNYVRHGWCNPNEESIEVDYVVHNWFFKKDWLKYYWSEIRDDKYWLCGEDMNFSYQLQKQGIKTFVPPHPKSDTKLWGSIKGWEYGVDSVSLYESNPANFRQKNVRFF